jgi:hypothetical protein
MLVIKFFISLIEIDSNPLNTGKLSDVRSLSLTNYIF